MLKIKVGGVPEHFNYPWLKCIEDESFKTENLKVEWRNYPGGTGEMAKALDNKEIDLAVMLTEGSLKEMESGKDFKIVQKYIESPLLWGIHVDIDSPYRNVEDLKGKTAAISQFNSGSHLMTHVLADQHRWDLNHLKFEVCKTLDGAIKALKNKDADYLLWERFTTKPFVDQHILRHLGNCPTPWPCFVIVTRENYFNTHQNKINSLLYILNKETSGLKEKKDIADTLAGKYDINSTDVKEWLSKTEWSNARIQPQTINYLRSKLKKYSIIS